MFRGWSDTWLLPEFRLWNMEDRLSDIRCPLLAFQGALDEYGTAAQLQALCGRVSGPAESLLLPDCGHIPHQQAKETVLREMTRFIRQLK